MVSLKKQWQKFVADSKNIPAPLLAFIIIVLGAIPVGIISTYMGWVNQEEINSTKSYIQDTRLIDLIFNGLIGAPLNEEFLYRGPVRLLILLFPGCTAKLKLNFKNIVTWLFIILPTYYWAKLYGGNGHGYPLDMFLLGIVFGWAVVKTKTLETAVVLHSAFNAINLIGGLIRYRILFP